RDIDGELVAAARGQVHIVVDELAPDVTEVGEIVAVDRAEVGTRIVRIRLIVEKVTDQAGTGVVRERRGADAVGIGDRRDADEVGAGGAQGRVRNVVADFVDGPVAGGGGDDAIF